MSKRSGVGEHVLVAVGGAEPADDDLLGLDRDGRAARRARVARRGSSCTGDEKRSTSSIADGISARLGAQPRQLVRDARAARARRCRSGRRRLVAGDEEQDQHARSSRRGVSREPSTSACTRPVSRSSRGSTAALVGERGEVGVHLLAAARRARAQPLRRSAARRGRCRGWRPRASDQRLNCSRSSSRHADDLGDDDDRQRVGERLDEDRPRAARARRRAARRRSRACAARGGG